MSFHTISDALSYLLKARPEALGHCLAFVKEAAKLLNPKTRNLICVIAKVPSQTGRGFRQYDGTPEPMLRAAD